jgi:hypothetical protein
MIVCSKTNQKGTGFLLNTGYLVTNEHVVRGSAADELVVVSGTSIRHRVDTLIVDEQRDLAVMRCPSSGGLRIRDEDLDVGIQVATWGYPLGYNGPAPLLGIGYLAGFRQHVPEGPVAAPVKHLVINAAFNPGNSGGPLFLSGDDGVVGMVVSKHAPIPQFLEDAIEVMANNKSGFVYTATDDAGNTHEFVESQLVAQILSYFRNMTQVVIGEAIAASELVSFLNEHGIPWNRWEEITNA